MKALRALLVLLAAIPAAASASEKGYPLQEANADVSNLASLQRGARNFVNYCLGCHSAKYMRYSQLATDLALKEDDVQASLMFAGGRIYDTMDTAMPAEKARQWFGNAPPDLSLIVRSRGADNAVLPGTAMPHVLAALQGLQRPRLEDKVDEEGKTVLDEAGKAVKVLAGLEPGVAGEMPAATYDSFVRDIVAFLEYVAEPAKARRLSLGVWVILFLLMFTAFTWFLYKEYWKDVK